jgi:hypothetical protein
MRTQPESIENSGESEPTALNPVLLEGLTPIAPSAGREQALYMLSPVRW